MCRPPQTPPGRVVFSFVAPRLPARLPGIRLLVAALAVTALLGQHLGLGHALPAYAPAGGTPLQEPLATPRSWRLGDYEVTALATYDVAGRVLSARTYRDGRESDVSPVDLALGWGRMADEELLASYRVAQRDRWYFVNWDWSPMPKDEIIRSSANTHILPASAAVAERLASLAPGAVVHLQGYLVEVTADDGWRWRSSLTREDTGDGSCEVFWVDSVEVVEEG